MNISREPQDIMENELTLGEAINSIWEWRKYRNQAFWKAFYVFGALAITLSLIPYLLPDLINKLGLVILVFPIMACLVSIFATYIIAVLYKLYKQVDKKYWNLLGRFKPEDIPNTKLINRLSRIYFGKSFSFAFLFYGIVCQFLNALVLYNLVKGNLP